MHRPLAVVPSTTLAGRAATSSASAGENTVSLNATSGADTWAHVGTPETTHPQPLHGMFIVSVTTRSTRQSADPQTVKDEWKMEN